MPLETGTTIRSLNQSNPVAGDNMRDGDDHIRLIKRVLKNIFPGAGGSGFSTAITSTEAELNSIGALTIASMPVGGIIMWSGSLVPPNWALCDGNSGTPDLSGQFIRAANAMNEVGNTGGSNDSIVVSHTHTIVPHTHTDAGHTHDYKDAYHIETSGAAYIDGTITVATTHGSGSGDNDNNTLYYRNATSDSSIATLSDTELTTDSAGTAGLGANIPAYYTLAFIMFVGAP